MTDKWFVVNVRDAQWLTSEGGDAKPSGSECSFEGEGGAFDQLGIRLHVLPPGEPNGLYHREDEQEGFLVLARECILLAEGEERRLGAWDFVGRATTRARASRRRIRRRPTCRASSRRAAAVPYWDELPRV